MPLRASVKVNPQDLRYVTPVTAEEVELLLPDIEPLLMNLDEVDEDIIDWLKENPTTITLVYYHGEAIFGYRRDVYKNSVELHGVAKAGWERSLVSHYATDQELAGIFSQPEFEKVIIRIPPNNLGAKGFAWRWGFKYVGKELDVKVYRLTKEDYLIERR